MRSRSIVALLGLAGLLCSAGLASAQSLSLVFHDGRVNLKADNVPVTRILAEWARLGRTRIVNGERVPGAPLTLELVDVPERQALDIVLRGAAGYMALARESAVPGASTLDKVLVLPTTTRTPATTAAAAPPPPVAQPVPFADRNDLNDDDQEPEPSQVVQQPNQFPRAGRLPNVNMPSGVPQQAAPLPQDDDDLPPPVSPQAPSPGNPFGGLSGGARPGSVTPPPAQNPNAQRGR